ncbi:MAG: SCO1664 family protein, partial [Chloroflexota bacterium]|nr:SCO1664 family protein [Chloroflexota bacterium]
MTDDAVTTPNDQTPCEDSDIERILRTADITDCKLVPWGSNYTFAVVLEDESGDDQQRIGIYKPRAGEAPLWDFPSGTLYQREYASYIVSQFLGWEFIPCTVIRDGPHGIGTVQLYIEPDEQLHYRVLRDEHRAEMQQMAIFDLVTNNADRKASHLFRGASDRKVWGIDHGLTFHVHPKLRTVIWDFMGEPIDGELLDALIRLYVDDDLP